MLYAKVTDVTWVSGNPFRGSKCKSRIYDTIEIMFLIIDIYFIVFCENAKPGKKSILVCSCKMSKIFNKDSCASCWWLVWEIPCTLLCTTFCSAFEQMEAHSLLISRVLIYITSLDSFLFSANSFKFLLVMIQCLQEEQIQNSLL